MPLGDTTHCTEPSKGTEWCAGTQEEERLGAFGSTVLQVFCDGLAYVTRQGQLSFPSGFRGVDSNLSFSPIDICETEAGIFSGPQRESGEEKQDRAVP